MPYAHHAEPIEDGRRRERAPLSAPLPLLLLWAAAKQKGRSNDRPFHIFISEIAYAFTESFKPLPALNLGCLEAGI
ncbi:MAG: hypothetical protein ACJAU7_001115 [Parvibaculaceae bacterium]|jgi:hypothetical protein